MSKSIYITIALLVLTGRIYACKCNGTPTRGEELKRSDLVIYGKVISAELISFAKTIDESKLSDFKNEIKGDDTKLKLLESEWILKVEMIVKEKIKGKINQDTVIIYTSWSSASCGYRFKKDSSYHVYAKRQTHLAGFFYDSLDKIKDLGRKNTFWTNMCTLTSEYYPGVDELKK